MVQEDFIAEVIQSSFLSMQLTLHHSYHLISQLYLRFLLLGQDPQKQL